MDDFFTPVKSLDELHRELISELTRLIDADADDLTFSDADVILYLLDLYFEQIDKRYTYLHRTPRIALLRQIRHYLGRQLQLMDARLSPSSRIWHQVAQLSQNYLSLQNSHTIA